MAGTGVGKFSSTAGNNTDNLTVNFAENMAPSNVNNAARELMGHIRDMYEQLGDGYFEFGDGDKDYTIARVDADTLTIASSADLSAIYFAGRKIRVTDGGANVVEGTITSTSHGSSLQTVNLTGISLASGTPTKVELGIDTAAFGGKIILDDDGDTYIEAPTDDTIDIYVAGAKDFVITANTFTAESGSTIAAQALTATTITTTGAIAIANDGNIGSAGDADAIAISSSGVVTFSQAPVFPDGSIAVADLDIDGATDIGAAIVDADLFIIDDGAGGTNRKVTASRLKTYAGATAAFTEAVTITVTDNSDTLTLISTDADANQGPILDFYRNSSSPADNDGIGQINFTGRNDNSQDVVYGQLLVTAQDVSDGTEDAVLSLNSMKGGELKAMVGLSATEIVLNNESADIDFRVESDGNANMLFVDGGNNAVGIGLNTPASYNAKADDLVVGGTTGDHGITIVAENNKEGALYFADGTSGDAEYRGYVMYDHNDDRLEFAASGAGIMTLEDAQMKIGTFTDVASSKLQVFESQANVRVAFFQSTHSSTPFGLLVDFDAAAPNNGTQSFIDCIDSSASRFSVTSNGAVFGNGTFGTLSDERIKKDIVDANSQWDDIKAIKVRNFKKKVDGDSAIVEIGVVAQELEAVSPKLISELEPSNGEVAAHSDFGTLWTTDDAETKDGVDAVLYTAEDTDVISGRNEVGEIKTPATHSKKVGDIKESKEKVKGVKYSVLQIKALKALQEAMTRIETLETKVKELEG